MQKNHINYLVTLNLAWVFAILGCKSGDPLPANEIDPLATPYKLEVNTESYIDQNARHFFTDLNGDGDSEHITIHYKVRESDFRQIDRIMIHEQFEGKIIQQINFKGENDVRFIDIEADGTLEIFASKFAGNTLYATIFSTAGDTLAHFKVLQSPTSSENNSTISFPIGMTDLNKDGRKDIVLVIFTGLDYQPRGIYIFDIETGEKLWAQQTGAAINYGFVVDLDKNGEDEIILQTSAPDNSDGRVIGGTDDQHSYLMIFEPGRRDSLILQYGGIFTTSALQPHDFNKDGNLELLFMKTWYGANQQEQTIIGIWDHAGKNLTQYREYNHEYILSPPHLIAGKNTFGFIDANRDGINEFIAKRSNGTIELMDIKTNIVASAELGETPSGGELVADLTGDGRNEIILQSATTVYVFSNTLELLAKYTAIGPINSVQLVRQKAHGLDRLFVSAGNKVYLLTLKKNWVSLLPSHQR